MGAVVVVIIPVAAVAQAALGQELPQAFPLELNTSLLLVQVEQVQFTPQPLQLRAVVLPLLVDQVHLLLLLPVLFLLEVVKVQVIHLPKITVETVVLVVAQEAMALKAAVTRRVNPLLEVMAHRRLLIKVLMVEQVLLLMLVVVVGLVPLAVMELFLVLVVTEVLDKHLRLLAHR